MDAELYFRRLSEQEIEWMRGRPDCNRDHMHPDSKGHKVNKNDITFQRVPPTEAEELR